MEPEVVQKKSNLPLIILLVVFLLALAGFAYWYLMMRDSVEESPRVTTTKVATQSAPTATESAKGPDDTVLLTAALATKTGTSADMLAVIISSNDGKFAKGTVNTKGEETGGGQFFAVKINSDWVIVHSGQDNPKCSDVNPHNFPATLVPECLDSNGEVVKR